jgi:hypothetical protein
VGENADSICVDREEFAELINGPRRDTLAEVFGMV